MMPNADARRELLRIPLLGTSVNRPLQRVCLSPLGGIMLTVSTHRKNVGWSGEEDDAVSSAEENKAIVRRLFKALAEGDLDAMRELLAPNSSATTRFPAEKAPALKATYGLPPPLMLPSLIIATSSLSRSQPKATGW